MLVRGNQRFPSLHFRWSRIRLKGGTKQHQVRRVHLLPLEHHRLVVADAAAADAAWRLLDRKVTACGVEMPGWPQQTLPAIAHLQRQSLLCLSSIGLSNGHRPSNHSGAK